MRNDELKPGEHYAIQDGWHRITRARLDVSRNTINGPLLSGDAAGDLDLPALVERRHEALMADRKDLL